MPKTYWSLLTACLAIGGIFPFAGFWSKDEILLAAFQSGHYLTFTTGLIVGGLTAFYMFRFFFLTFHGQPRSNLHGFREDPYMTFSIMALVVPTILAGILCRHLFADNVLPPMMLGNLHLNHPVWLPYIASLTGIAGMAIAWIFYGKGETAMAEKVKNQLQLGHKIINNKFYIDEMYLFVTKKIIFSLIAGPIKWFDRQVVDGFINFSGAAIQLGGKTVRLIQNGQLRLYLSATVLGLIFLVLFYL